MRKTWGFGFAAALALLPVLVSAQARNPLWVEKPKGTTKHQATFFEEPVLSPGQDRFDHPAEWAPEMAPIPVDVAERALVKGLKSASARIRCNVTVVGTMGACTLLEEQPKGSGMGQVALSMTTRFLITPLKRGGKPVEGMIDILVPWAPAQGTDVGTSVAKGDMTVGTHAIYTHVVWVNSPSYADLLAALPAKARAAKVGGTAIIRCVFTETGRISICRVSNETPVGYGFGNAALTLANHFQAPAKTADGGSVQGAWVTLNIYFPPGMVDGSATSISSVQWLAQPTALQWTSVYPPRARAADVSSGSATLSCTVDVDGGLKACGVTDETPAGLGFGAAAMASTPAFVMKVWNDDGEAMVGRTITFPLTFQTKDGAMRASIGAPVKPAS